MPSTWMDPLIKAQHAKRRAPGSAAAIRAVTRQFEASAVTDGQEDELPLPDGPDRGKRRWESVDVEAASNWESDPDDILPEVEREIGIADWIDPETGEPAEGQSPPHLEIE